MRPLGSQHCARPMWSAASCWVAARQLANTKGRQNCKGGVPRRRWRTSFGAAHCWPLALGCLLVCAWMPQSGPTCCVRLPPLSNLSVLHGHIFGVGCAPQLLRRLQRVLRLQLGPLHVHGQPHCKQNEPASHATSNCHTWWAE